MFEVVVLVFVVVIVHFVARLVSATTIEVCLLIAMVLELELQMEMMELPPRSPAIVSRPRTLCTFLLIDMV